MRKQGFTFICIFLFLLGTKVKVKKIRHIERTWLEGIAATAAIPSNNLQNISRRINCIKLFRFL